MSKTLVVATEIQKAVFTQVLLDEISRGFWKNARPADHAEYWKNVDVVVGTDFGAKEFDIPRNYNFVNPDFFKKSEARLLEAAKSVDADITIKQLKKQLITLNQILGARLKEAGGSVSKLPRGRKQSTITSPKVTAKTTTRKAIANIVEPTAELAEV